MKLFKKSLLLLLPIIFIGCVSRGALVDDQISEKYIQDNFEGEWSKGLHLSPKDNFVYIINAFKEGIINDNSLSESQKEKRFKSLEEFTFEKMRYLTFYFLLGSPTLIKQQDYQIVFNDRNGNSIIEKTLISNFKETITTTYSTGINYSFVWFMKLKKPFTQDTYDPGTYSVTIIFPNKEKLIFELDN